MSSSALAAGLRRLRGQLAVTQHNDESDENLLHTFLSRRDEAAFAVLVRRHGPMVLHVCRRVLGHEQDAEDAFQATFLVLARNAVALRNKTSLASFLHSIAYRTALKARQSAARRRKHEGQASSRSPDDPVDTLSWREVRSLLDEETARLPEVYRSVFVLCILEGVSREEAARRLGLKEGTVSSRLTAARKRLAQRLTRRGVELTAVLAASMLVVSPAAALPAGLMDKTLAAVLATAAGEGLTAVVSASVAPLVQSATAASKGKIAAVVLLAVTLLGSAGLGWNSGFRLLSGGRKPPETCEARGADTPRTTKDETTKDGEIQGRVLDLDGKPQAGAKILMLGEGGKPQQLGTTAADGRFRIALAKETKGSHLIAQAEGFGIDFADFPKGDTKKPIEFRLVKDQEIRGRIVNTEGKPVAGVRVAVTNLNIYADNSMGSFLVAWKKRHFMSGIPWGTRSIGSELSAGFATTTDADGRFVLRGLGAERLVTVRLSRAGIADEELWIVNRGGFDPKPYNQATLDNIPKGQEHLGSHWLLYGPDLSAVTQAEKILRGAVKDVDTGKGRAGVLVVLTRREGGNLLQLRSQARTDAQGCYEIRGAHKAKSYMLEVFADTKAGYLPSQVWANDTAGYQPITADIAVKKGVIVTGKMIDGATGKPVPGHVMIAVLNDNPFVKNYPDFSNSAWFPMQRTGADGSFRVVAIPGPVLLMGGPDDYMTRSRYKLQAPDPKYPKYFDTRMPDFPTYYLPGGAMSPVQGNWCKVLEIKPDAKTVEQDIVHEPAPALPIQIRDAEGNPLSNVWITGNSFAEWHPAVKCEKAECTAYQLQPGKPRLMVFFHPGRKLVGTLTLKGDEKPPVVATLGPAGSIKGRLVDADGKPLAGVAIGVHYRQRVVSEIDHIISHAKQGVTDANGAFAVDDLIPGQKFELSFQLGKRKFVRTTKQDPAIEIKSGECHDLGAIQVTQVRESAEE